MKDAIGALGKYDAQVPGLLVELPPPALPADRLTACRLLLTLPPIRRGQREHEQREHHRHVHRALGFLRRMAQLPRLLRFLDTTVLDQTAVVIVITGLQWLPHRGV